VGEQRMNVFVHAGQVWGAILPSTVNIRVEAAFDPLTCTATSAVLGQAVAINLASGFANAPLANTLYVIALANKLAGMDLVPGNNDISAEFNSNLNGSAGCLGGAGWYYGFEGNDVDLLPVVLHEFGHGLGFATATSLTTGNFSGGIPDIFARNILDKTLNLHWDQMTAAQRVASAISGNIFWDGHVTTLAS